MCCRRTLSGSFIQHLGLIQDFLAEIAAEFLGGAQIGLPPEEIGQFRLHRHQFEETDPRPRFEFNQNVNVAIRPEVAARGRRYCVFLRRSAACSTR